MLGLVVSAFVKVYGRRKLGVNPAKNKVIFVERKVESYYSMRIDGTTLEVVGEFIYLVVVIDKNSGCRKEVGKWVAQGS